MRRISASRCAKPCVCSNPAGCSLLQDIFLLEPYFGAPQELQDTLRGWGARRVEFIRTCDREFIPDWVKLPFMVGTLAILRGEK